MTIDFAGCVATAAGAAKAAGTPSVIFTWAEKAAVKASVSKHFIFIICDALRILA